MLDSMARAGCYVRGRPAAGVVTEKTSSSGRHEMPAPLWAGEAYLLSRMSCHRRGSQRNRRQAVAWRVWYG